MICSKQDYLNYLEADRKALKRSGRPKLFVDEIWKFQRLLRKLEYYLNCKKSVLDKVLMTMLRIRFHRMSIKLGFSIPPNVCGPGLSIAHVGNIIVNRNVRLGANCRIHVGVNIGANAGDPKAVPKIGNFVYIGPGAKLFGAIEIADGIAIGANAVVNKSVLEPNVAIGGIPARIIREGMVNQFWRGRT